LANDDQPADVIHERGAKHQKNEIRIRPSIKDIAEEREPQMFPPLGQQVVNRQRQRQVVKDEEVGTEDQRIRFLSGRTMLDARTVRKEKTTSLDTL